MVLKSTYKAPYGGYR